MTAIRFLEHRSLKKSYAILKVAVMLGEVGLPLALVPLESMFTAPTPGGLKPRPYQNAISRISRYAHGVHTLPQENARRRTKDWTRRSYDPFL
jgi:hypothetical protein